jgi:uncharacterized membrane protein
MSTVQTAIRTVHLSVSALWVGAVLFVTLVVLPAARDGDLNAAPLERIVSRLVTLSRLSALVLLLSGGHLAATLYTAETLTSTTRGHLVLGMVALWFVLAGLVEVGSSRLQDALREKRVRAPARDALRLYGAASVVALLTLVDAGLLTAA